jgi:hypothetical protein
MNLYFIKQSYDMILKFSLCQKSRDKLRDLKVWFLICMIFRFFFIYLN